MLKNSVCHLLINRAGVLLVFITILSCNKSVSDFVKGAKPPQTSAPVILAPNVNGGEGIKVSSGSVISVSTDILMRANVTATNKHLISSDISAKLSLSKTRSLPQ